VTRVLLITGARSLATRPGAEAWARAKIAEVLAGCDLLIVGDATGPDRWAMHEGLHLSHGVSVYWTRGKDAGWVLTPDEDGEAGYGGRWAPRGASTHPLARNAAMVRDAVRMRDAGHDVLCLALLDGLKVDVPPRDGKPGKRATRGTEHTVGLARAAGLTVREEVWRGTSKGATP
jgi:hypothetical protein